MLKALRAPADAPTPASGLALSALLPLFYPEVPDRHNLAEVAHSAIGRDTVTTTTDLRASWQRSIGRRIRRQYRYGFELRT